MTKHRNRDREILEVYLLNLLLSYRIIFRIVGPIVLVYAIVALENALEPALERVAAPGDFILVFGSFQTVARVLDRL